MLKIVRNPIAYKALKHVIKSVQQKATHRLGVRPRVKHQARALDHGNVIVFSQKNKTLGSVQHISFYRNYR